MANIRIAFPKIADPRRVESAAEQRWELFPYLLGVLVLLTLVSIFHVWSRVKVVDMHLQIGELRRELKEQQQEQGRLKLEVASLKNPARIEALAKGELGMSLPTEQQVVMVK
ncbi:MAG TPA: cell division protein FtsL [Geobacteraceae bacterium]